MTRFFIVLLIAAFSQVGLAADVSMASLANKYNNLIHTDRIESQGDSDIILNVSYASLPKSVKDKLEKLDISVMIDWDVIELRGSEWVINEDLTNLEGHSIFKVVVEGKTLGYIFNVTNCNIEECYGWDALYLGPRGGVVYKSF